MVVLLLLLPSTVFGALVSDVVGVKVSIPTGCLDGTFDGGNVGSMTGTIVGLLEGTTEGNKGGRLVGVNVGNTTEVTEGLSEGTTDGVTIGMNVGKATGFTVGISEFIVFVGVEVGAIVGAVNGFSDLISEGMKVGRFVGMPIKPGAGGRGRKPFLVFFGALSTLGAPFTDFGSLIDFGALIDLGAFVAFTNFGVFTTASFGAFCNILLSSYSTTNASVSSVSTWRVLEPPPWVRSRRISSTSSLLSIFWTTKSRILRSLEVDRAGHASMHSKSKEKWPIMGSIVWQTLEWTCQQGCWFAQGLPCEVKPRK